MRKAYNKLKRASLLLLWLATSHMLLAQERTVSGTVKDEGGLGMPGVNVLLKGTSTGTATDATGQYKLTVAGNDAVLVFTFIGYTNKEVNVGSQSTVDVQMDFDAQTLTELVVTGYSVDRLGFHGEAEGFDICAQRQRGADDARPCGRCYRYYQRPARNQQPNQGKGFRCVRG
jgi:CarboxypepD_reg-like domain